MSILKHRLGFIGSIEYNDCLKGEFITGRLLFLSVAGYVKSTFGVLLE